MRKTYVATVTKEVIFTADVEAGDNLQRVAEHACEADDFDNMDPDIKPIRSIPGNWDMDCLVYGTHKGTLELRDALTPEMAPEYHKLRNGLLAAAVRVSNTVQVAS